MQRNICIVLKIDVSGQANLPGRREVTYIASATPALAK